MSGEADELIAARQAILTFSDKPGFVQALRRLEKAILAAGPRSPEAAQGPLVLLPIYCEGAPGCTHCTPEEPGPAVNGWKIAEDGRR